MSPQLDFSDAVFYHTGRFPPGNLNYEALFQAVGNARAALGRYDQMLKTLHDSEILLAPLRRQEAIASSRMEGTISTIDELLRVEAEDDLDDATDPTRHRTEAIEVFLYHRAMREAQASIEKGHPLSAWLIRSGNVSHPLNIFVSAVLEGSAYVKVRNRDQIALPQHQRNDHPADAPISVVERVKGFKLGMRDRGLSQRFDVLTSNPVFQFLKAL